MADQPSPLPPGTPAPAFTLPRSSHASISLADLRGRRAVLLFYPADWEPVSGEQLALCQDYLAEFERLGASLLAISTDQVWSHGAFARAGDLRFPLLADTRAAVSRAYGVYDDGTGASARALFVLDEDGIVRWSQVCPAGVNPGVDGVLTALEAMGGEVSGQVWPALPYVDWRDTLETLHMWTQIVGKVKLELVPFLNEWWQVGFTVTARGLTTSTIPFGRRVFQVDFDFIDHRLDIKVSDGDSRTVLMEPRSVADFYDAFMAALEELGIEVRITTNPVEVENAIAFDQDTVHASYDRASVTRWWRVLLQVDRLLQRHRTPFVGKSSPVLFWWGSFDLSQTRFSGRPAPAREWPARWMALGADQEHASAGFWPGSGKFQAPAFFAYAYPEPPGCRETAIEPDAAYYLKLSEFILPYEEVRRSASPDQMVLDFFQNTFEVEARLAGWDLAALEKPDPLAGRESDRDPMHPPARAARGDAQLGRLRRLPQDRRYVGPPAALHGLRPRRVLRPVPEPARHPALQRDRASPDQVLRAG